MKWFVLALASVAVLILISPLFVVNPFDILKNFTDREVLYALWLSAVTSLVSATAVILIALPAAYAMAKELERPGFAEALLSLPNAMPPVAVGATLLIFFSRTPIGEFINNIIPIVFSVPGIIVAQVSVSLPLALKPLKSSMKSISDDVLLMAKTLGCYRLCLLRKVVVPAIENGIKSSFILALTRAFAEFGASVTLAGAIKFKTETIPIAIYLNLSSGDVQKTVSLIALSSFVALAFLLASMRWEE